MPAAHQHRPRLDAESETSDISSSYSSKVTESFRDKTTYIPACFATHSARKATQTVKQLRPAN